MADIAILVAEEFERRIRSGRGFRDEEDDEGVGPIPSAFSRELKQNAEALRMKFISEPKTLIGLAASRGFFSA